MTAQHVSTPSEDEMLDPDVRFLLANERTLLAWIRTALTVVAGGVALTQFGHDTRTQSMVGLTAIILGGFMATVGYIRFQAADKAIRRGELPVRGREPILQVAGVTIIAFVLAATHMFDIW